MTGEDFRQVLEDRNKGVTWLAEAIRRFRPDPEEQPTTYSPEQRDPRDRNLGRQPRSLLEPQSTSRSLSEIDSSRNLQTTPPLQRMAIELAQRGRQSTSQLRPEQIQEFIHGYVGNLTDRPLAEQFKTQFEGIELPEDIQSALRTLESNAAQPEKQGARDLIVNALTEFGTRIVNQNIPTPREPQEGDRPDTYYGSGNPYE